MKKKPYKRRYRWSDEVPTIKVGYPTHGLFPEWDWTKNKFNFIQIGDKKK